MPDNDHTPCSLFSVGHVPHPIQARLACGGPSRMMDLLGVTDAGVLVAPVDSLDAVESWCVHDKGRRLVAACLDRGITTLIAYERGFARIGPYSVSYTTAEHWRECVSYDGVDRPHGALIWLGD